MQAEGFKDLSGAGAESPYFTRGLEHLIDARQDPCLILQRPNEKQDQAKLGARLILLFSTWDGKGQVRSVKSASSVKP